MLLRGLGIESILVEPFVALVWISYAVVIRHKYAVRYIITRTCKKGHHYLIEQTHIKLFVKVQ